MHELQKVLMITSSGGNGHQSAAKSIEKNLHFQDPRIQIIQKDLLTTVIHKKFGEQIARFWKKNQEKGSVFWLAIASKLAPLANFFFLQLYFIDASSC